MNAQGATDQGQDRGPHDDVAIIGMAGLFPGAPDLPSCWQNIVSGVDATSDPPPEAWDGDLFYNPDSGANDRVYCKRGGFLGPLALFDPLEHGVMPLSIQGTEPDQWLALQVARAALADAGYTDVIPERHRTAVILGKGTYLNRGNLTAAQHGQVVDQTLAILRRLHPEYGAAELEQLRAELKRALPPFNADTAPGLIPNVTVGRIANKLDLMGPSYTVDGACASSLLAVGIAQQDLQAGRCDLALVGGIHVVTPVPVLMLFCHLGALSRRQQIRPFDKDADGTLLSEGLGMLVLKRRADAERDGNRIYALIKGVGVSSDGRALSVLAPRVEGQVHAIRQVYEQTGIAPQTLGLVEAHGTATEAGDATEVRSLTEVFGARKGGEPWCALGTIKSMIGHTMPAAGAAGLIKAALALYHRTLPPTINVDQPNPALGLERTPFYVNTKTRPWVHGGATGPRRAGVNAFGFGGVNAHALLEEYGHADEAALPSLWRHWEHELLVVRGDDRAGMLAEGRRLQRFLETNPAVALKDLAYTLSRRFEAAPEACDRLAIVASSAQDLRQKLERALDRLSDDSRQRLNEVGGVFYFSRQLGREGRLAFLFPGEGAQYVNMLADLCLHFPQVRASFDEMDRLFQHHDRGYLLSQIIFPPPAFSPAERAAAERRLWQMDVAIEALTTANHALHRLLMDFGLAPHAMVGHSTGELSAMRAAGMLDQEGRGERVLELNRAYGAAAGRGEIPAAALLSVAAGREQAETLVREAGGELYAAMDNCPHQVVLVGEVTAVARAQALARQRGLICELLPFDRAYHTPLYAPYAESLHDAMTSWIARPPQVPLYSCTSARLFPTDLGETRRIAHEHWVRPVEFRRTIERMYEDGVRLFVEVGPGGKLSSFVEDTLRGRPSLVAPANVQHRSGITQLLHLLGQLIAHGLTPRLAPLYERRDPRELSIEPGDPAADAPDSRQLKLETGWPPMVISDEAAAGLRASLARNGHSGNGDHGNCAHAGNGEDLCAMVPLAAPSAPSPANGTHKVHERSPHRSAGAAPIAPADPAGWPPQAEADQVMGSYLRTMEQFLAVQQEVMSTYLVGGTAAPLGAADRVAPLPAAAPEAEGPGPQTAARSTDGPAEMAEEHSPEQLARLLLQIVSEKTGYPASMIALDQDLEADLGIDSIKRVEILGALQQHLGGRLGEDLERASSLRSLQGVIDLLTEPRLQGPPAGPAPRPAPPAHTLAYPLLQEILAHTEGETLLARCELSLAAHPFLRDHALGRDVARLDPELTGLPVMPLTMTMELLAEAAAVLLPGQQIVCVRDMHGHRWVTLEAEIATLQVRARRTAEREVRVQLELLADGGGTPVAEACFAFAPAYEPAPPEADLVLGEEQGPRWAPDQLYEEAMFHGPLFRGVRSLVRVGVEGAEALIETLPQQGLLPEGQPGQLLLDPVLLDQPGQVVGFWAAQRLERGYLVFPFHLRELWLYGPPLPPGRQLTCRARVALVGEHQVSSDLDVVASDGSVWCRFVAWEDRRFDIPHSLYRMLTAPDEAALSEPYEGPISGMAPRGALAVRRISMGDFPAELFRAGGGIWLQVLAWLVLGRRERGIWRELRTPQQRRIEWLLGRVAAKEVVRDYLQRRHGLHLHPADIEILPGAGGRPLVGGGWTDGTVRPPHLSITHCAGSALAIIAEPDAAAGVGIDSEPASGMAPGTAALAFTEGERRLLGVMGAGQRDEWQLRAWCAKEAVAKALGHGLVEGPGSLEISALDPEQGLVSLRVLGELARRSGAPAGSVVAARTCRDDDRIVAVALC